MRKNDKELRKREKEIESERRQLERLVTAKETELKIAGEREARLLLLLLLLVVPFELLLR